MMPFAKIRKDLRHNVECPPVVCMMRGVKSILPENLLYDEWETEQPDILTDVFYNTMAKSKQTGIIYAFNSTDLEFE